VLGGETGDGGGKARHIAGPAEQAVLAIGDQFRDGAHGGCHRDLSARLRLVDDQRSAVMARRHDENVEPIKKAFLVFSEQRTRERYVSAAGGSGTAQGRPLVKRKPWPLSRLAISRRPRGFLVRSKRPT